MKGTVELGFLVGEKTIQRISAQVQAQPQYKSGCMDGDGHPLIGAHTQQHVFRCFRNVTASVLVFFTLTHYTCPFNLCYCFCMPRITHPLQILVSFCHAPLANNIHLFYFPASLFILSHVFIGGWLAWKEARQLDWFDIGMFRSSPAACACSMWVAETAVLLTHILCKYTGLAIRRGGVAGESTWSRGGAHRDCFCYRCLLALGAFSFTSSVFLSVYVVVFAGGIFKIWPSIKLSAPCNECVITRGCLCKLSRNQKQTFSCSQGSHEKASSRTRFGPTHADWNVGHHTTASKTHIQRYKATN